VVCLDESKWAEGRIHVARFCDLSGVRDSGRYAHRKKKGHSMTKRRTLPPKPTVLNEGEVSPLHSRVDGFPP
jgi:hypothetical protein